MENAAVSTHPPAPFEIETVPASADSVRTSSSRLLIVPVQIAEDDIDSRVIRDIVEQVWRAKNRRQLVFTSHSANFVVNGDAELVVCCDYVKEGDQTRGVIKATGAIDTSAIKDEITSVTEGGMQAFKLRMDKYGF